MPVNNLRIIYKNLADSAASVVANQQLSVFLTIANAVNLDTKSIVYRSAVGSTTSLTSLILIDLGFNNNQVINTVVLAFTNLTPACTIRLYGTATQPTIAGTVDTPSLTISSQYDSGNLSAMPYSESGKNYWNTSNYSSSARDNSYARIYCSNTTAYRYYVVEVKDTRPATGEYLEFSRLIAGTYWSPKFNTSYGLSKTTKDLSTTERTQAGDIVDTVAPSYDILSFDLKYLQKDDRIELQKIIKHNRMLKAIFVSLFPECTEDYGKEKLYQIYGRMSQIFPIEHPLYEMYSSQIDIEEV